MARILVVDDDRHIREVVRFALETAGHEITEAADGAEALALFRLSRPEVVVLDVVMPEADGLEVCRQIRAISEVPILFLSSRDDEIDRVLGLELGADDYVTKPFSPRELVARIKAMLRRCRAVEPATATVLRHGRLEMDLSAHRCRLDATEVALTVTEFNLLAALLARPGQAFTRAQLVDHAWGPAHHLTDRTIDSHVRRIRSKFAALGASPVETVYGLGYRLSTDEA